MPTPAGARRVSFDPRLVAEIKRRTPLAALIRDRVALKPAGSGELVGLCPFHDEKTASFTVRDDNGFYHCFGCGAHGDAIAWVQHTTSARSFVEAVEYLAGQCGLGAVVGGGAAACPPAPRATAAAAATPEAAERRRRAAVALFLRARPLAAGDPVWRYLAGRGIDLARLGRPPRALRCDPACRHAASGRTWPAMLAAVVAGDGRFIAVHRTYLAVQPDGFVGKAPLANPKLALGGYAGGCIRLARGAGGKPWRAAPPGEEILAGEGIEDALAGALWLPDRRTVAVVALGNLAGLDLPPAARGVLWLAQNDRPGSGAARQLAAAVARLRARGKTIRFLRSPCFVKDAAEYAQRLAAAA